MSSSKIVFMGTPDFAVPSLDALLAGPDEVVAVVTQPDRPSGRGQRLRPSPVKSRALDAGIRVLQPRRLRKEEGVAFREELVNVSPDVVVVAAYGQILPAEILALPPLGCINVHASLLPRWRGASPIQWAILSGDDKTGVSIMRMDEGLDTGPVILQHSIRIEREETAGRLHDRLSKLGAKALMEAMDLVRDGKDRPASQKDELATYAPMLRKEDGRMDFELSAEELERRVRALNPWPGAFTKLEGRLLKVLRALSMPTRVKAGESAEDETSITPGTVVAAGPEGIDLACGQGFLRVLELQPEGKRPMTAAAFAAGRRDLAGTTATL